MLIGPTRRAWKSSVRIIDRIANLRVLLLVTFRPEFVPPWIGQPHVTALTINQTASWWVGDGPMLPFVLLGGLLIIRKTQRLGLGVAFTAAALGTTFLLTAILSSEPMLAVQNIILYSPLVFFAAVIITEPLTMPPLRVQQLAYGALVGFGITWLLAGSYLILLATSRSHRTLYDRLAGTKVVKKI